MRELIDLHCHIVPYVDDGSQDMEEAIALLTELSKQGVIAICATPHLRARMFETPDIEVKKHLIDLKNEAADRGIPVKFYMSREYHCDRIFFGLLEDGKLIPMARGNTVLCEFSYVSESSFMLDTVDRVIKRGYRPLVAHIERYGAIHRDQSLIKDLKNAGALIQVNAGALTGAEGFSMKLYCRKLAKKKLIDVVASDSHDPVERPPKSKKCAEWLEKNVDAAYAKKIMYETPLAILSGRQP